MASARATTKGAAAAAAATAPGVVEFFDIASKAKVSWSPNTARTRMVLNYKLQAHPAPDDLAVLP
jgi:hypothetical protein